MKKLVGLILATVSCVLIASPASALLFTMDSYEVTLHKDDPGLVLDWMPILDPFTSISKDFDSGESITIDLFKIGTTESFVNFDDVRKYDIMVDFKLSSPGEIDAVAAGESFGLFRLFRDDLGIVRWDGDAVFDLGDEGIFKVGLSDAVFGTPGWGVVKATFAYSVPEPGTLTLFITGFFGLAVFSRKKFMK